MRRSSSWLRIGTLNGSLHCCNDETIHRVQYRKTQSRSGEQAVNGRPSARALLYSSPLLDACEDRADAGGLRDTNLKRRRRGKHRTEREREEERERNRGGTFSEVFDRTVGVASRCEEVADFVVAEGIGQRSRVALVARIRRRRRRRTAFPERCHGAFVLRMRERRGGVSRSP